MRMEIDKALSELRERLKKAMPDNPVVDGWSSFAQCDEDGVIRECLRRIETMTPCARTCIEIGCSDGLENNTHQLLLDGYTGVWIEGDANKAQFLSEHLGGLEFERLRVKQSVVDQNNCSSLMREAQTFLGSADLDFLGLDIDGNDLHLTKSLLSVFTPKLIVVEYNAKFPPPTTLVMRYNAQHEWSSDDYFGASLQAWVNELTAYRLVGCNLSGVNAFFVRDDLSAAFTLYPIEALYQPPRYWLASGSPGHPNSLKWLKQSLAG